MKKFIKEYGSYILIIIVVILIRTYLVTPVKVNGTSMEKTLSSNEVLILNKLDSLQREDIVVVNKDFYKTNLIKRIIALPGEKIKCVDGIIYINDEIYSDKYAYGITSDFGEIILKDDEYFLLGDNRLVSQDSRNLGPVKEKYIEGTCDIVLFPFNKIGKIK